MEVVEVEFTPVYSMIPFLFGVNTFRKLCGSRVEVDPLFVEVVGSRTEVEFSRGRQIGTKKGQKGGSSGSRITTPLTRTPSSQMRKCIFCSKLSEDRGKEAKYKRVCNLLPLVPQFAKKPVQGE